MKRILSAALSLMAFGAANAGELQFTDVSVDRTGFTYSNTCRNYSGYFSEFGSDPQAFKTGALVVAAEFKAAPIGQVLQGIVPAGWSFEVGEQAKALTVNFSGREPWLNVLRSVAGTNNAMVLVDWSTHRVLVDKI